uniref:Putative transketolase domain containing protein n=1 Tax=viral metagenome TaxID=1070528 RepID=A0A6M3KWK9_9ZZZZ
MKSNDVFIFSKASGVSALYAVLAEKKIIPKSKVAYYLKKYPLASSKVPGVFVSTGSLGHGIAIAAGVAFADRTRDVYCLISDAEVQEGSMWSSILFARHHKLENLKVIVDKNGLQACGRTRDIIDIDVPLYKLQQLFPIEVVYTVKGKGIRFMESDNSWHYRNLTKEEMENALCQI